MKVREIMSLNVATCRESTPLTEVAQMMIDNDCGMIPVIAMNGQSEVVGTITDRDIACRVVAKGKNSSECTAGDAMSPEPICVSASQSINEAEELMKRHQIRRLVVLDEKGVCCGVLAQADIARSEDKSDTGMLVNRISRPSEGAPRKMN